ILRNGDERVQFWIQRCNPIQIRLSELDRRNLFCLDHRRELATAEVDQFTVRHTHHLTAALKIGAGSTESSISRARTSSNCSRFRCRAVATTRSRSSENS